MKKIVLLLAVAAVAAVGCKRAAQPAEPEQASAGDGAVVYMTTDITPESLIRIFDALGVKPEGRVAVKISSGEGGNNHYLQPSLIGDFVKHVGGTLVECNTAYPGTRMDTKQHWETIRDHGFLDIAQFDIMDEEGTMQIPVADTSRIKYDIVGSHLANYDFLVSLAHFKGHQMGGFGGVLKNQSIGVASTAGKLYIHSAGRSTTQWIDDDQDGFLESMAAAAQGVHNYFVGRKGIVYINVMNNMSIDCDCNGNPKEPELKDMGILASTDPVALDQACLDLVYRHQNSEGDNAAPLIQRVEKQHGVHTIEHAEAIGLGTRKYHIVSIDK